MADIPKRNHIGFIMNHTHDMYVTSPLNLMEEIFVSLPNLLFKENAYKMDEL